MKVVEKATVAQDNLLGCHKKGQSIGLVPTMGALHEGHLSLVKAAQQANDITVVSIFVNPIQFNNPEDFDKYPESLEDDLAILKELGVDYVFVPTREEMYPKEPLMKISFGLLEEVLEGNYRPGHFNGVAIVVAKLFNILQPTRAYFGQKDLQQFKIVEQLVNDLSMSLELVMMPIIREPNGLAMSSRNRRLSMAGLEVSAAIYRNMAKAAEAIEAGQEAGQVLQLARKEIDGIPEITTEYFELVNYEDLSICEADTEANRLVLCFAGYIEGVRLIDNLIVGEN